MIELYYLFIFEIKIKKRIRKMSRPMRPSLTFNQAIKSVLCQNYINFKVR